jgi:hypothetical protein
LEWSADFDRTVAYTVEQRDLFWTTLPRVLERRRMFRRLETVRGAAAARTPAGSYLIVGREDADVGTAVLTVSSATDGPLDPLNASKSIAGERFVLTYGAALELTSWLEQLVAAQ